METIILNELQENKKTPCVSIIISTHKKSNERTVDQLQLNKAIEKATELINFKYGTNGNGAGQVIENLKKITKKVDFVHNDIGLGFFVSPDFTKMVKFPFPVEEKIIVGESFEIRDVLYLSEYLMEYYILSISEKEAKLLKGSGENLKEVKDKNFPVKFIDDYEYERPSLGNSYDSNSLKSTEKDKSIVEEIRLIANLKKIDKKLSAYLGNNIPLLITGISKEFGYFMKITTHKKFVAGKIKGGYTHNSFQEIGILAFEQIKNYLGTEEEKLLIRLDTAIGKKLAAIGVEEVWKAAKEGKGLLLLVEKDFVCPGFVTDDTFNLIRYPLGKKHKIIADAADDIMETVLAKNGKVVIMGNGKLKDYEGIALIERYH